MSRPAEPPHPDDAVLIDFGRGRRLERLAGVLVDRPLPQARLPRRLPGLWAESSLSYTGGPEVESRISAGEQETSLPRGWRQFGPLPDPWRVAIPLHATTLHLEVRPAASGQTGLFLEQAPQFSKKSSLYSVNSDSSSSSSVAESSANPVSSIESIKIS